MLRKSWKKKENGALVFLLYLAQAQKREIIHSDTPGHRDEVVSVEVQVPHRMGGVGGEKKGGVGLSSGSSNLYPH